MIEPYKLTSDINKITLVSAGHVVQDMAMLKLRTVGWPEIFKAKIQNIQSAQSVKLAAREASIRSWNKQLGLLGTVDEQAARRIVEMMQTPESLPVAGTAKVGVENLKQRLRAAQDSQSFDVKELIDDVD